VQVKLLNIYDADINTAGRDIPTLCITSPTEVIIDSSIPFTATSLVTTKYIKVYKLIFDASNASCERIWMRTEVSPFIFSTNL
jgi:hypothetical protein